MPRLQSSRTRKPTSGRSISTKVEAEVLPEVRGVVLMRAFDAEDDVMKAGARVSHGQILS